VIAAHPDDEAAGCAGVILQHLRHGDRVRILCVTDGGRSRALGLPPEQMGAVRRAEMETAADALGAELEWIGLSEGAWSSDNLLERLREALARFRPHLAYAPSRVDFHPEHLAVAREFALALALSPQAIGPVIRVYPIQVPLTDHLCNLVAPVDRSAEPLHAAFTAHSSQLGSLRSSLRPRRYAARFHGLTGWVEEFWQLAPATYARLHRDIPRRSLGRTFRGLRPWAFSDPLSYLRGRRERQRLARVAAQDPTS
jgi:LmbE family N-acetylglucosaminyl deacetylase